MTLYRQILLSSLVVFIYLYYGTSYAQAFEDKILSVDFNSILVTDALHKLSNVADVAISLDGKADKELISKSYINTTIDEILLDMFRRKNIVALFRYSGQELVSINLWFLPQAEGSINIIKQQVGNNYSDNDVRSAPGSFSKRKASESSIKSQITTNSKLRNKDKSLGDTSKAVHPYASLSRERHSSSITEASENETGSNSDIKENKDDTGFPENDIPPVPEPVQSGGLEPPPMPPVMSLYNN